MKREPLERTEPDYAAYEFLKRAWQDEHPEATPREYEQAMRELAKECGV